MGVAETFLVGVLDDVPIFTEGAGAGGEAGAGGAEEAEAFWLGGEEPGGGRGSEKSSSCHADDTLSRRGRCGLRDWVCFIVFYASKNGV